MGVYAATIEMRAPEVHRERLHERVKGARMVMVLSHGLGAGPVATGGAPMELVRTDDDTTMYVATVLDAAQAEALERQPVTVVVPGDDYALFIAEAAVSRDQALLDLLWSDSWPLWCRGTVEPELAIVILTPIEGTYWEDRDQHAYVYRLLPAGAPRDFDADGWPLAL